MMTVKNFSRYHTCLAMTEAQHVASVLVRIVYQSTSPLNTSPTLQHGTNPSIHHHHHPPPSHLQSLLPPFHSPAFSTPFATSFIPFSTPDPAFPSASPTGFPADPVAAVIVSPMPRVAAPVTPPSVRVTPPTVLPRVEVTNWAAPVAPESVGDMVLWV